MKNFLNLSRNECLHVYEEIVRNASDLNKSANLSANNSLFGVATSIQILSIEEIVKAMIVFFNGIGIDVLKIKEIRGVFSSHKLKHETAILFKLIDYLYKYIFKKRNKGNKNNILSIIKTVIKEVIAIPSNIKWFDNADNLKQRGFYVDYIDELKTPQEITQEQYLESKKQFDYLASRFKMFQERYTIMLNKEKVRMVKDANEAIELYIMEYKDHYNK